MLICRSCKIEYEEGKKFCKACGSKLVPQEDSISPTPISPKQEQELTQDVKKTPDEPSVDSQRITADMTKPKCLGCGVEYEEGKKFCKNCGTPLETKEEPSVSQKKIEETKDGETESVKICPRCNTPHATGKFCKKCGTELVDRMLSHEKEVPDATPPPLVQEETPQTKAPEKKEADAEENLFCPTCKSPSAAGKFCKKCGSTLVPQGSFQKKEELQASPLFEEQEELSEIQSLGKKSIKRLSQEWVTLSEEKRKLESLIKNLQGRQSTISQDFFNTTFERYQAQLMSISSNHQQIEKRLESVKTKTSAAIHNLINELKPIEKKMEEVKSLHKSGAITKADFSQEKKELKKNIKSRESAIKKYRDILAVLPVKMGGKVKASKDLKYFLRPIPIAILVIIILLVAGGGYLLWEKYYQGKDDNKEIAPPVPTTNNDTSQNESQVIPGNEGTTEPTTVGNEAVEVEKIKSLFEDIKNANLLKDIDRFMACYALDFQDREEKRKTTLDNWNNINYQGLSYTVLSPKIVGDTANARVEWSVRYSSIGSDLTQVSTSVLDVKLKKENYAWKIQEIMPVQ
jgi:hypothetical protein